MIVVDGEKRLEIGDKVIDTLTGGVMEIIDVFVRGGVLMVELTDSHGCTTTTTPNWLKQIDNEN